MKASPNQPRSYTNNHNHNALLMSPLKEILPRDINKKKRKPVKCGLLEHFNKLLQQKQSKEHLEKYQNDRENFSSNVSMKLLKITKEHQHPIIAYLSYEDILWLTWILQQNY